MGPPRGRRGVTWRRDVAPASASCEARSGDGPGTTSAWSAIVTCTGLVLSGGGTRGAYEAGVLAGIVDVLGLTDRDRSPIDVFVGSSVGAINAAWLVSHCDRGDLGVQGLVDLWTSLDPADFLRLSWSGWRRLRGRGRQRRRDPAANPRIGGSLLDPAPLERLVEDCIDWERLHRNIATGRARALVVPALEVADGVTAMFCECSPGTHFTASRDPSRRGVVGPLTPQHVLASAAIPLLYPARRIGPGLYFDGGLRFNTPLAPAIRLGAERLVVFSPLKAHRGSDGAVVDPGVGFLAGKLLNAVLLDPIQYDLQVLDRFNALLSVLEETLTPDELARVQAVIVNKRGVPYRCLRRLLFTPSEDLGSLGTAHLRAHLDDWGLDWFSRYALRRAVGGPDDGEADWTSFVLFDGELARRLVEVGHRDATARSEELRRFWG
ncbi:MAG: hypothetical protein D6798_16935 [Deltaproteobacteria bacterium]|nr:MAG: hypothetical protein D6798_16935 [Deltaproteobacteria bacterium]